MKTLMLMSLMLLFMASCSNENIAESFNQGIPESPKNQEQESDNENGFDEPLNIKLENFDLINIYEAYEVEQMRSDIADFILSDDNINEEEFADIPQKGILQVRKVLSTKTGKIDAYSVNLISTVLDIDIDIPFAACDPKTKKCCSKGCVVDTLEKIYGADSDVDVSYVKGTFCRTLTWTYQDC